MLDRLSKLYARALVLASTANTYLVIAAGLVPVVVDYLVSVLPTPVGEKVTAIGASLVAILGFAILLVRRVAVVVPEDRGILPTPSAPRIQRLTPGSGHGTSLRSRWRGFGG